MPTHMPRYHVRTHAYRRLRAHSRLPWLEIHKSRDIDIGTKVHERIRRHWNRLPCVCVYIDLSMTGIADGMPSARL